MKKLELLSDIMTSLPWTGLSPVVAEIIESTYNEDVVMDTIWAIFENLDEEQKDRIIEAAEILYEENYNESFKNEQEVINDR